MHTTYWRLSFSFFIFWILNYIKNQLKQGSKIKFTCYAILAFVPAKSNKFSRIGPGHEFEKSQNLSLAQLGAEYRFEITEDSEIALNLAYENKEQVYDEWTFGVAFNKKIWQKESMNPEN